MTGRRDRSSRDLFAANTVDTWAKHPPQVVTGALAHGTVPDDRALTDRARNGDPMSQPREAAGRDTSGRITRAIADAFARAHPATRRDPDIAAMAERIAVAVDAMTKLSPAGQKVAYADFQRKLALAARGHTARGEHMLARLLDDVAATVRAETTTRRPAKTPKRKRKRR